MKTKTIRKWTAVLSFMASVCIFVAGFLTVKNVGVRADGEPQTATVETVEGFSMGYGAEIRAADGDGGIRFTVNVSSAAFENLAEKYPNYQKITFYTLMTRTDKFSIDELTMENAANSDYIIKNTATMQPNGNTVTSYKTTYVTSNAANYSVELAARGVAVVVDAEGTAHNVYATTNDNVRSMEQLAVSAVQSGKVTSDVYLSKYFKTQSATAKSYVETVAAATELKLTLPELQADERVVAAFAKNAKLTADFTSGVKLTNLSAVTSATLGDEKSVTLYTDKNNAYTVSVKTVTKAISKADDLRFFQYSTDTAKAFSGYYVLTQNIDASNYVHNYAVSVEANGLGGVEATSTANTGLTGTFDGQGYTIDSITFGQKNGLFGIIGNTTKDAVVKNVAITNVQFTGLGAHEVILAQAIPQNSYVRLENVYIHTPKITGNLGGIFAYMVASSRVKMNNCIFNITNVKGTTELNRYGSLASRFHTYNYGHEFCSTLNWTNTYVISKSPIVTNSSNSCYADAKNITTINTSWNRFNVYRYETAEDMAKGYEGTLTYDATNGYTYTQSENKHDFKSFTDSGFWTMGQDGIPVWNNLMNK